MVFLAAEPALADDDGLHEQVVRQETLDGASKDPFGDSDDDGQGSAATEELPPVLLDLKEDGILPPSSPAQKEDLTRGAAAAATTVAVD